MSDDRVIDGIQDRTILVAEDDMPFRTRMARALEARGFTVTSAETVALAIAHVRKSPPAFAVIDLRLGDGNGLDVIEALHRERPDARAIEIGRAHV